VETEVWTRVWTEMWSQKDVDMDMHTHTHTVARTLQMAEVCVAESRVKQEG